MAGSSALARSRATRAERIQTLLTEIGAQMQTVVRLAAAVVRLFYDAFLLASLTAAIVVIIGGELQEALIWGGTVVALVLGWAAAKLAGRAVARLRRVMREEWIEEPPAGVDRRESPS